MSGFSGLRHRLVGDQGRIVTALLVAVVVVAALAIPKFGSLGNLLNAARSSSVLGIVAIGMAIVVIGRGLDLSIVVILGTTSAFALLRMVEGSDEVPALVAAFVAALALGVINGVLVAYVEIPALFVTLATSLLYFGLFRLLLVKNDIVEVPQKADIIRWLGSGDIVGIPNPVIIFAIVASAAAWLGSRNGGRYLFAIGDNPDAARLSGLPVRPFTVASYAVSALLGCLGGITLIAIAGSYDLRAIASGTLLYDVVAVVVIGGVSLAGGRGSVLGVVSAALLLGVIGNVMTLLNFDTIEQSLAKAFIVLLAIVLDSILHPRDEETARVGEL